MEAASPHCRSARGTARGADLLLRPFLVVGTGKSRCFMVSGMKRPVIVGAPAGQFAEPMLLWCELAAAAGHVTVSNKGDPKNSLSRKRLGSAVPRGIAFAFAVMDGLA